MKIIKTTTVSIVLIGLGLMLSQSASAITKCKDANGKWHYGDNVEHLCSVSKITTLDSRGVIKKQVARKKTDEQLAEEERQKALAIEAELEAEQQEAQEKILKERVLGSYESEADIEKTRTQKISAFEKRKKQYEVYLGYLAKKKEMLNYRAKNTTSKFKLDEIKQELVEVESEIESSENDKKSVDTSISSVNNEYDQELALFKKYSSEDAL